MCLGVLTKPDRIERGEESSWISMINGQSNALCHGWFSVKQPTPRELEAGISWEDARAHDQDFFENTAPWSTIPATFRHRLGCSNLIQHLGETLGKVILSRCASFFFFMCGHRFLTSRYQAAAYMRRSRQTHCPKRGLTCRFSSTPLSRLFDRDSPTRQPLHKRSQPTRSWGPSFWSSGPSPGTVLFGPGVPGQATGYHSCLHAQEEKG
jgi:hypothetical protein